MRYDFGWLELWTILYLKCWEKRYSKRTSEFICSKWRKNMIKIGSLLSYCNKRSVMPLLRFKNYFESISSIKKQRRLEKYSIFGKGYLKNYIIGKKFLIESKLCSTPIEYCIISKGDWLSIRKRQNYNQWTRKNKENRTIFA